MDGGKRKWVALVLVLVCMLGACARALRVSESESTFGPLRPADTRGAQVFDVDPQRSSVQILVFRAGALARLGHNHVVTSSSISGRIWLHPRFERSGIELEMPVASFVVDDQQARAERGAEFSSRISQEDIAGTRRNMLGPDVLNAQQYPIIRIQSVEVTGTWAAPSVTARITLKGVQRDVTVPLELSLDDRRLRARGQFDIRQSDFGMKPFSVALGALAVQDRLHIEFEIAARRVP